MQDFQGLFLVKVLIILFLKQKEVKADIDISGVYTGTRGYFSGMTKMFSIFSPNPIAKTGDNTYSLVGMVDLKPIGDNVYRYEYGENVGIIGTEVTSDGKTMLTGASLIREDTLYLKIAMVAVYLLITVAAVIVLIVKLIKKLAKKSLSYKGAGAVTLSQLIRFVSVAGIAGFIAVRSGVLCIPKYQGVIFALIQMICILVFVVMTVIEIITLCSKNDEKGKPIKYILSSIANVYSIFFILFFELICFWK